MHCPFCKFSDSRVIDSRTSNDGQSIKRRRICENCNERFSTIEKSTLYILKRSGILEEFSKEKLLAGVKKAIQGRNIDEDVLQRLASEVEDKVRQKGSSQVDSYDVGLILLDPLKRLDTVAYLRFASVYKGFGTLEDFEREIATLKANSSQAKTE